jgi:putative ABC transport system permease protein
MNLLLARAATRAREVAIRTALGANRRRVIRQLLTESLLLGAIGGVAGVALALAALRALPRMSPVDLPYWIDLRMDWRVLLFVAAATIGSALLFGLAPAIKSSGVQPAAGLSELRRGVTAGLGAGRLRQALVATQVALSVVLLVGAGLMIKSLLNLANFDLGFRGRDVLSYRLALPPVRYKTADEREAFFTRMREKLSTLPGVRNVATTSALPSGGGWWRTVQPDAKGPSRPADLPIVYHVVVSPDYFATMGIRLERGRGFTDADGKKAPVVIISRKVAEQVWRGRDPIGLQVRIDPFLAEEPVRTIVGIVGDVRAQGAREEISPAVYVPEAYSPILSVAVVIRANMAPQALAPAVRSAMRELDPELPVYAVRTVDAAVAERAWTFRFFTYLLASFAGVALLLAAVGLGGIMAHVVIERTHEIGVRMALGATARDVVGMVVTRGMALVAIGAAVGLAGALAATRLLASELFGVQPNDAGTIGLVVAVLAGAAFAATWLPARRAARVDPAVALRWD